MHFFTYFSFSLLLLNLIHCADISVKESEDGRESISSQRQIILDALLDKFNALILPLKVSCIPWESVTCTGWPEEVQSKLTKDWNSEDLAVLKHQIGSINFSFPPLDAGLDLWRKGDCKRMLEGTYSNTTFDRFCERYRIISKLGTGSFGFVLKCERIADGFACAVKCIFKPKLKDYLYTTNPVYGRVPVEVDYLSRISHPGVIGFLDYFDDGTYAFLVTELFGTNWSPEGSEDSLHDLLEAFDYFEKNPYSEETVHFIFNQLYRTVCDLHEMNIYHGDVKCENILLDSNFRIKLIDFGIARTIPRDSLNRECLLEGGFGTERVLAPEVLIGRPYRASAVETWTLGIVLFMLKTLSIPFSSKCQVVFSPLRTPPRDETGIFDLIEKMLNKIPQQRIKLTDIAEHPWMKKFETNQKGVKRSFDELQASSSVQSKENA